MNKLGFAECGTKCPIDPAHFFFANIPRFLEMRGFKPAQVKFDVIEHDVKDDLVIDIKPVRVPLAARVNICRIGDMVKDVIKIEMSRKLISALHEGDLDWHIPRNWCYFGKYMHLWCVRAAKVPIQELVPAKVLIDMKKKHDGVDEIIASFNANFDAKIWTPEETAQNYAAAAVGLHLSELMSSSDYVINSIHPKEVAEIIFSARASNWDRLTSSY
ncbi:MAG: hypothetical protein PHG25_03665 [Candidatus Pacebacteria bacterium]|nr:hypothetical protein [Candidatus Paceibacterota bacterium]